MFTLGSKSLVINDASLVTINGTVMSIPGFGAIDNTDPAYTKVTTTGLPIIYSTVSLAAAAAGQDIAVYWTNLRYIGEGLSNMSSAQAPLVIAWPASVATLAEAWALHEDNFGTSELFELVGAVLTSKNAAVNIIEAKSRPVINPLAPVEQAQTGFRYGRFGGTVLVAGTAGFEGIGTGTQVEEGVRTANISATDPYSTKEHGSEEVELDALYDIYDFTVQAVGIGAEIHDHLAQHIPDENVINHPIQLRIYAKQGDASAPIAGF